MTESEFNRQVDASLRAIEDAIDASGADIDYDQQGGVLTLLFASGAKLIFSRQPPLRQLWLAAPSGGFHFDWRDSRWQLASGETLSQFLSREASRLAGESLEFAL
ncbi:iron donor protein CyaY [Permianibacter sp. IMCC34836]|uniref:iron donor protein CyaY n=1 Tax=Permianibacter fluminis TaxID=2738515 RepID=UPI001556D79A|nr:iron donor protein CyaY [Permianibacter fluminis]NQD36246.1 iron donor protein CyaY [Permianibacter fluminis]